MVSIPGRDIVSKGFSESLWLTDWPHWRCCGWCFLRNVWLKSIINMRTRWWTIWCPCLMFVWSWLIPNSCLLNLVTLVEVPKMLQTCVDVCVNLENSELMLTELNDHPNWQKLVMTAIILPFFCVFLLLRMCFILLNKMYNSKVRLLHQPTWLLLLSLSSDLFFGLQCSLMTYHTFPFRFTIMSVFNLAI